MTSQINFKYISGLFSGNENIHSVIRNIFNTHYNNFIKVIEGIIKKELNQNIDIDQIGIHN